MKIANKSSKMAVFRWKRLFLDHGASIEVHYVFGNWIFFKKWWFGKWFIAKFVDRLLEIGQKLWRNRQKLAFLDEKDYF